MKLWVAWKSICSEVEDPMHLAQYAVQGTEIYLVREDTRIYHVDQEDAQTRNVRIELVHGPRELLIG